MEANLNLSPPSNFEMMQLSSDNSLNSYACLTSDEGQIFRLIFADRPFAIGSPHQIASITIVNRTCTVVAQTVTKNGSYVVDCAITAEQLHTIPEDDPSTLSLFVGIESVMGVVVFSSPKNLFNFMQGQRKSSDWVGGEVLSCIGW